MFEQLVKTDEIRCRLLIVENPESSDKGINETVESITNFILSCKSSGNQGWERRALPIEDEQHVDERSQTH